MGSISMIGSYLLINPAVFIIECVIWCDPVNLGIGLFHDFSKK